MSYDPTKLTPEQLSALTPEQLTAIFHGSAPAPEAPAPEAGNSDTGNSDTGESKVKRNYAGGVETYGPLVRNFVKTSENVVIPKGMVKDAPDQWYLDVAKISHLKVGEVCHVTPAAKSEIMRVFKANSFRHVGYDQDTGVTTFVCSGKSQSGRTYTPATLKWVWRTGKGKHAVERVA